MEAALSDRFNAVYQIRLVTREGRVYRSQPIMESLPNGDSLPFPAYNRLTGKRQMLSVPASLVRDVRYRFNPEAGDIMLSEDKRREHDAILGGFDYRTHSQPGWNLLYAPKWQSYDGDKWQLHFDKGSGLFLGTPLFSRSAFTLEMDVSFDDVKDQTLVDTIGGRVTVKLLEGRLIGSILPAKKTFRWAAPRKKLLEPNRFYHIRLNYDLEKLTCQVDGETVASIPVEGTINEGWCICIGGAPVNPKKGPTGVLYQAPKQDEAPNAGFNFSGTLRSLRISNR